MSDLFHDGVPDAYLDQVVTVLRETPHHTYQLLTKRAARLATWLHEHADVAALPHVWWGVSVEDRRHGLPRIARLQAAPASHRFLSIEPLLEDLGALDLRGIGWVIVGGESGSRARRMDPAWVRVIRDQCATAGVPFFFKQWGGVRTHLTRRVLDGQTHDGLPPRR